MTINASLAAPTSDERARTECAALDDVRSIISPRDRACRLTSVAANVTLPWPIAEVEILHATVISVSCFLILMSLPGTSRAQTLPTDNIDIQVKNLVQNGDDVTVLVEVANKSSVSFVHIEGACAVFNGAGIMIGSARSVLVENLRANETAYDGALVPVLKSQVASKGVCRVNKAQIAE